MNLQKVKTRETTGTTALKHGNEVNTCVQHVRFIMNMVLCNILIYLGGLFNMDIFFCEELTWFNWSSSNYINAIRNVIWFAVTMRSNRKTGCDQKWVGMRMTQVPERKKVTKHIFPPRHTHAHSQTQKRGPLLSVMFAIWGCDAWLPSLLPLLHQHSNCTTMYCSLKIQWSTTWRE